MFALGRRAVLEEFAVRTRLAAAVSASPTVKASAPVELSSLMVWLAMLEMVGGVFGALGIEKERLQPAARLPRSPEPSSTTYSDQVPLGERPLNTDSVEVYGPAGAGAGGASSSPVSPGSTLVGW